MLTVTVMMMMVVVTMMNIVMNKTAAAAAAVAGLAERIDSIRRQVSRLSDLGKPAIRLSSDCYLNVSSESVFVKINQNI